MPTKPIPELINRDIDENIQHVLGQFADALEEVVNYGTHVLSTCGKAAKNRDDEALVTHLLLRHALEIIDAISILTRHSAAEPCAILLRSLLETYWEARYIISGITPQERMRRARCFIVWHIHSRMKWRDRLKPETQAGSDFYRSIDEHDEWVGGLRIPVPPEMLKEIDDQEKLLGTSKYQRIDAEYQRLKRKNPHWFCLFDGPKTIQELAERVGFAGFYQIHYRLWSSKAHGTDLIDRYKVSRDKKGKAAIAQLRVPFPAQATAREAVSLALLMYQGFIKRYAPEGLRAFTKWYMNEIKKPLAMLNGDPMITEKTD